MAILVKSRGYKYESNPGKYRKKWDDGVVLSHIEECLVFEQKVQPTKDTPSRSFARIFRDFPRARILGVRL